MSKQQNSTLLNYFSKKPRLENEKNCEEPTCSSFSNVPSTSTKLITSVNLIEKTSPMDIKHFVNNNSLSNHEKLEIIENLWFPEPFFSFPQSGKRNLRFQYKWFKQFEWLSYSKEEDGAYCKYCVLFLTAGVSKEVGQGHHQSAGQLITMPFKNWKKALEKFSEHQNCKYHKTCLETSYLVRTTGVPNSIHHQLDKEGKRQVDENSSSLIPIIQSVIFCGKQGIPLRGHRDSGQVTLEEPLENDGNFRALLRYRAKTDETLRHHLNTCSRNAMYTSWRIQNEIIESCNDLIRSKIVEKINQNKFFSILADESTDISTLEQMNLCVRYVNVQECSIEEMFLQFVILKDVSGKGIAEKIISELTSYGVELKKLRGQGYDGASAMCGKFKGVSTRIEEIYPTALYVHCASHSLNLAVSNSCEVTHIRNCIGTINTLYDFFHTPKRQDELKKSIEENFPEIQRQKLKRLCSTRWTEQYNSVAAVVDLFPAIMKALENICDWPETSTSSTANQLISAIKQDSFVISLLVLNKVFSLSHYLCKLLQDRHIDLMQAVQLAEDTMEELKLLRTSADVTFKEIFEKAENMAHEYEFSLKLPRVTSRQTKRPNVNCTTPEAYYRISIFIPFLDAFISALQYRFIKHKEVLSSFQVLFPENPAKQPSEKEIQDFKKLTDFYVNDMVNRNEELNAELNLWYRRIFHTAKSEWPTDALSGMRLCKDNALPNIKTLLHLLATLPVTTCENERSFSTLRRLKTYLRNTMGEKRLNGLALLNVHREHTPSEEAILKELVKKSRRLNLKIA